MLPDYSETKRLSQDIPKTQTVDGKGKKLDAEIVLEMLETIPMEFYPDGRPHELHGRANYPLSKQKPAASLLRNAPPLANQWS